MTTGVRNCEPGIAGVMMWTRRRRQLAAAGARLAIAMSAAVAR